MKNRQPKGEKETGPSTQICQSLQRQQTGSTHFLHPRKKRKNKIKTFQGVGMAGENAEIRGRI